MDFLKLALSSVFSVAALFLTAKLMGHKQVAQLDFFDYVSGITIGSIAAELATELESPWKPFFALVIYGFASFLLNTLTRKFPKVRKYINGTPTILMNDGKLYRENMKKAKLDLSEFLLLCRELGYFDLDEIKTAIFEHNGKLSVLPKAKSRPIEPGDLDIKVKEEHIFTELIMDGRILEENLSRIEKNEKWLRKKLKEESYESEKEIFLALYQSGSPSLKLYPFDKSAKNYK